MKKCSYCGRENPDEATNCSGCGQNEFKIEIPPVISMPTETQNSAQKYLSLRLLIAACIWLIISGISLYVAWQQANHSMAWWQQWETRRALKDMGKAIAAYQLEFKVSPHTFEQLQSMTNTIPEMEYWSFSGFTDSWQHPFIFSNEETNCLIISYGADGKPGGSGINCDLTTSDPYPQGSSPTFAQFFSNKECQGMITSSFICGGLAALLSLLTVRVSNLTKRGLIAHIIKLCIVLVGVLIVTIMITALHIPSGH